MQQDEIVLKAIPTNHPPPSRPKKTFPVRLFSLVVLITVLIGVWEWSKHYHTIARGRQWSQLTKNDLLDVLQYDNGLSMEQIVLKYKVYKLPLGGYTEPNILLSLCIILTFPFVINSIQKQTATPIAFFEFNLPCIYLQILRLVLDLMHYLLTSKCICLASGTAAIWIHLLTKITYCNSKTLLITPIRLFLIVATFLTAFAMIVLKDRLDLLIAMVIALVDVIFMQGGTIKFPKDVFQEKEEWASKVRVDRLPLWESFVWNEYKCNERLCVDSFQYYVSRKERMIMIS